MDLVQSQGKQNKKVTTIFSPEMKAAVQTLIHTRFEYGIHKDNKYMFANLSLGHLDHWQVLQKMAVNAGCSQPKLVSSTRLRKYLATVCQVSNSDSLLSNLRTVLIDLEVYKGYMYILSNILPVSYMTIVPLFSSHCS